MSVTTIAYATIRPKQYLSLLSHREVASLMTTSETFYQLFRRCTLAVLNAGSVTDNGDDLLAEYHDFDVRLVQQSRGVKLEIFNAPASAFVNGVMIQGIADHVFAALRDVVYCQYDQRQFLQDACYCSEDMTEAVFRILRNANVVRSDERPDLVVCWGGHSISREEYDFTKSVGYHLGLRGLNIATGCGVGAMKGPMKGAAVAHGKQKFMHGRYIGITEPSIIAAEPPNSLVSELVILPDIEKRLEAFVRLAHAIVVFPGGPGTTEEILYVLAIMMCEENKDQVLPLIFACAHEQQAYFASMDAFLCACLGEQVRQYYTIIVDDAENIAETVRLAVQKVQRQRLLTQELYSYNWQLTIPFELQQPFVPTHESMAKLVLSKSISKAQLCMNLRAAFSGVVAGNIKASGIRQIKEKGAFVLYAEKEIADLLNQLLQEFVQQGRMTLSSGYRPSYKVSYL